MKSMNRSASLLLSLALAAGLLAGCGNEAPAPEESAAPAPTPEAVQPEPSKHEGAWSFTDSLGRTVEFNGPLTRVAPSGKMAQQCLYAVNPDVIIGLGSPLSENESIYYSEEVAQLPVFGSFYGKKADFNLETVLAAEPQVVIDVGAPKKGMEEDLDMLQEQLGIPVIFVEAKLTDMRPAFETLGELLDSQTQADALADYAAETISEAEEKAASIPEDQRKSVYYGIFDSGLTTCATGDQHAEVIDLVGARNVAPADLGHSFVDIDMERLLTWDPEIIIFGPHSAYDIAGTDPNWMNLTAISSGSYYEVPGAPYSWVDQPPAANRILGVKWLGNLLYPEVFDYDMVAEATEFYDLFYHYDLTPDEAKDLMANSPSRAD